MIYKVYHILHVLTCFMSLLGGFAIVHAITEQSWPMLLVPVPAVILGAFLSGIIVSIFPRIRFINDSEIDGFGYVHSPIGGMLLVCLIGFSAAMITMLR